MKAFEDLAEFTEKKVLKHLVERYAGETSGFDYGSIGPKDRKIAKEKLKDMKVLIAYESVGDYGCDSSSFFLLQNKLTEKLYEVHGSHCSCYGFEGQLHLEPTTVKALKFRNKEKNVFSCGGYDRSESENQKAIKKIINEL